jgi:predicted DNA-binding transcriptional regulator YafY
VKFTYNPVTLVDKVKEEQVYPIQILFHEGLFYLWAVNNLETDEIRSFRIDRITSEIEFATDDKFNSIKHRKSLNIENILEHIVGVVPPESNKKPVKFKLKFYDWAAAYVKSAPIHHSWEIITDNKQKDTNSVVGTMTVYDTFEIDFLLGRFRDYCEILEPKDHEPNLRKNKKSTRF